MISKSEGLISEIETNATFLVSSGASGAIWCATLWKHRARPGKSQMASSTASCWSGIVTTHPIRTANNMLERRCSVLPGAKHNHGAPINQARFDFDMTLINQTVHWIVLPGRARKGMTFIVGSG
jgi:hypothetical protein